MTGNAFVTADAIRTAFSNAMSDMYRAEVPLYGTLLEIVDAVNRRVLEAHPEQAAALDHNGERDRLSAERHGAIRLGTADELSMMRRAFAVMGMDAVGYYDLTVAGVPVHSTAFRPVDLASLNRNPFRVFTSLLRLDLIDDPALRARAAEALAARRIFTDEAVRLIAQWESDGGLSEQDAAQFVAAILETFRWHSEALVDEATYHQLHDAHRLIADIVSFRGPHINHLTPRTLDIDAAQAEMLTRGMDAKKVIEGPPARQVAILLRQTSFTALQEKIRFSGPDERAGSHTARFGEIEQRGIALTLKGRALYDSLLDEARDGDASGGDYDARLAALFRKFPDDRDTLRREKLAYFRYALTDVAHGGTGEFDLEALLAAGAVRAEPIVYEDFLPVSAAGIFQSNLGGEAQRSYNAGLAQAGFEAALGAAVIDPFTLYEAEQARSITAVQTALVERSAV